MSALAYVNHGRWVADCTRKDCSGAEALRSRQSAFHCSNCHHVDTLVWPADADEIWDELQDRPVPQTRNWFPAGHPLAERFSLPSGQTVDDLREEKEANS